MRRWFKLLLACLPLLTACQAGGRSMQASEFFTPPMVELLRTIQKGDETAAQRQIAQTRLDLNVQGKEGITPLLWLVMEKDQAGAKLALKLGANPNFRTGHGNTAVNMVSGAKSPEWLKMMLDAGGDPNALDHNKTPALFNAINEERWADIKLLIERGADVNLKDAPGRNSALYAAYLNEYEVTYWLIEQGADINIYDDTGSNLAFSIEDSLSIMSPQSPQYPWAQKVKQLLQQRGVKFPPLSPEEVRERRAKGEPL